MKRNAGGITCNDRNWSIKKKADPEESAFFVFYKITSLLFLAADADDDSRDEI